MKAAIVVLADTETHEALGRAVNAMVTALDFKEAGVNRWQGRGASGPVTLTLTTTVPMTVEEATATALYDLVPGVHGAHGIFDDQAHGISPQLWATTYRTVLGVVARPTAGRPLHRGAAVRAPLEPDV